MEVTMGDGMTGGIIEYPEDKFKRWEKKEMGVSGPKGSVCEVDKEQKMGFVFSDGYAPPLSIEKDEVLVSETVLHEVIELLSEAVNSLYHPHQKPSDLELRMDGMVEDLRELIWEGEDMRIRKQFHPQLNCPGK